MKKVTILSMIALVALFINACDKEDTSPDLKISNAVFNPDKAYGTLTDQDGNEYKTINRHANITNLGTPITRKHGWRIYTKNFAKVSCNRR
jgi:PBP1b-binding outer membrane lipoprotein LpoB